jgi:hypothetical protein
MNKETEYEKDLNEMKEQILKEGDTLLTKRDLLERFCKIDKEYDGRPWNLLQILANINILIGEEPCEDAISRTQALSDYADWYGYGYRENTFYKLLKDMPPVTPKQIECEDAISRADAVKVASGYCHPSNIAKELAKLPPVTPIRPKGHWAKEFNDLEGETKFVCSSCGKYQLFETDFCYNCGSDNRARDKE